MPLQDQDPYLIARIFSSVGSLLGSSLFLFFLKPKTVKEGFYRLGLSLLFTLIFSKAIILILALPHSHEIYLAIGFICGIFSWTLFSIISRSANNIETRKEDVFDIIKKFRNKN